MLRGPVGYAPAEPTPLTQVRRTQMTGTPPVVPNPAP